MVLPDNSITMADLKYLLSRESLESKTPAIAFKELAELLFSSYLIRKGERTYRLTDIEFYLYNDSHRDIITYPRNCTAGYWFFHASGVDIAFESFVKRSANANKPTLTPDAFFGGILIRGIERFVPSGANIIFDGPIKAMDELFDQFDAFGHADNFPRLTPCEPLQFEMTEPQRRHGFEKDSAKKVHSIITCNYLGMEGITEDILILEYAHYLDARYRYTRSR